MADVTLPPGSSAWGSPAEIRRGGITAPPNSQLYYDPVTNKAAYIPVNSAIPSGVVMVPQKATISSNGQYVVNGKQVSLPATSTSSTTTEKTVSTLTQLGINLSGPNSLIGQPFILPNAEILAAAGVSAKDIKKYALQPLNLPTMGPGNLSLSSSGSLMAGILNLPPSIQKVVMDKLGLNNTSLGKTVAERVSAMMPVYTSVGGHIGAITTPLQQQMAQTAALTQSVGQLEKSIQTGNNAVLLGARESAKYSAEASADVSLTTWGIDTPEMTKLVHNLASAGMVSPNEILEHVRSTNTYKAAFPGLAEYNTSPGAIHMTESQYQTYTQTVMNTATQFGAPMPSQTEIGNLLKGHVSAAEYNQRVTDIYSAVSNADPNVKKLLAEQYGVDQNNLMAYFADPKKALPVMQRQVATAEIQDYGSRVGLTGLTQTGASQLADMAKLSSATGNNPLGAGVSQIQGALLNASKDMSLTRATPGQNVPTLNTNVLIGSQVAGFAGTNQAAASRTVQLAEQAKAAPFEKGGGYAESNKGVTGIGYATT